MKIQRISSTPDSLKDYIKKIWLNRSLIFILAKRDLKIKYAQTVLGLTWTLVQPLIALAIYTLFFSGLMNFNTAYPYILFVLSGILFWNLFSYILSQASSSLSQNQELIKKLAFPKIILPFSKVLLALVEFSITLLVLLLLIFYFPIEWRLSMLLAPLCLIPLILFALGMALFLSALTIKKRDLFHLVPFLVNFGIWLTPVFYPVSIVPEKYLNLIYINPIASVIQLFRWSMFGEALNPYILIGLLLSFLTFIVGFSFFKKNEDKIIDVI
ncbi:MAG: ABC transporter permease [Bacteroidetes bacterium]|nr:ABC transporter permease [Bacteroidota bacterium]